MTRKPANPPFTTLVSNAIPIDIVNCDTDQLIPARFARIAKDDPDYHRFLLADRRFDADGNPRDFPFDQPGFKGGRIIVADDNWGCGSSREHAVWALTANDIRCVIAPSVADIHHANCVKNGVLPVCLPADVCATLRRQLRESPGAEIAVDLDDQSVTGPDQTTYRFEIDPADKRRLLQGLDEIGLTEEYTSRIDAFRTDYRARHPWAG